MFSNCDNLSSILFDINCRSDITIKGDRLFEKCSNLKSLPRVNNIKIKSLYFTFSDCSNITEIPEDYFSTWDFSYMYETDYNAGGVFYNCYKLRKIPSDLSMLYNLSTSTYGNIFYALFSYCMCLDEIKNLPVPPMVCSENLFESTFELCNRLKRITFSLNDGMPKTASWQNQVIDLTYAIGYSTQGLTNYGIPSDTRIIDDASYQLLKDNEDAWTRLVQYSRYNHDSAVETINTLPDTSAYLAESGGTTNIIKFKGANGSATDGGAINTLTEAEIAVAAAKGWTVTLE